MRLHICFETILAAFNDCFPNNQTRLQQRLIFMNFVEQEKFLSVKSTTEYVSAHPQESNLSRK